MSPVTVGRYIKNSGYTLKRAKTVLMSPDLDYREKVELLLRTLHSLSPDDLLFFIDEMGPLRVKRYGGRSYMKEGVTKVVPQFQAYKGSVTLYGALSATTNQITWFFGKSKDTNAMIDLIEVLYNQYIMKNTIFITWDAASWHSSNRLVDWINKMNNFSMLNDHGPVIELIPLPSCSQFLNVIESVFSSMKNAVIYNSDYESKKEMKSAISRHFQERNEHCSNNPKRAGSKIWNINFFSDYNNIRSGNYRKW